MLDEQKREKLTKKITDAKKVIREALERFDTKKMAITWTGGKDSTMVLWLWRQVCEEDGVDLPVVFSIDEYDHFDEVHEFIQAQSAAWDLEVKMLINRDVVNVAGGVLDEFVEVSRLNERNRAELRRIGYEEDEFPFEAESFVGNHLMKTVPFNLFIEQNGIEAVFQGLRWDEHISRANDEYFAYREPSDLSPAHWRINPILHFTERDIWDINLDFGLPFCSLYAKGYRSLGAASTSKIAEEGVPAWEQDLEHTGERGGRREDKEKAMEKLRALGYM
jgi:phosphoadenosine phosphosulfate reductase